MRQIFMFIWMILQAWRVVRGAWCVHKASAPRTTVYTWIKLLGVICLLTAVSACQQPTETPPQTAVAQLATATEIPPLPTPHTPLPTSTAESYPAAPTSYPSHLPTAYPVQVTATLAAPTLVAPVPTTQPVTRNNSYLPVIEVAAATPTATVPPPPTATPAPMPTVDFTAVRANLQAQGQELAFVKIGFHVTLMEDETLIDLWTQKLDAAGVPVFLKSVDNAEPLFKAQELMKQSGVPHVLVFRASGGVPNYDLPPAQAAQLHWEEHRALWPPELDPNLVWMETINEVDKNRSEWLAQFALETARLAMNDGFKWAAFGWASGEPEPEQWQSPAMLDFLRLAGANPERLAIALHEYSYDKSKIGDQYPFKIGRFQALFRIADQYGIPRPTVLITEWGWEYRAVPEPGEALRDIAWAAKLYAAYPQVKGAAIWHFGIGCCFSDISQQTERLIEPLLAYSLTNYFAVMGGETAVNPDAYRP